jgi:hypothetical protein
MRSWYSCCVLVRAASTCMAGMVGRGDAGAVPIVRVMRRAARTPREGSGLTGTGDPDTGS